MTPKRSRRARVLRRGQAGIATAITPKPSRLDRHFSLFFARRWHGRWRRPRISLGQAERAACKAVYTGSIPVGASERAQNGLPVSFPTENAPAGSRGEFWGYYREERYLSLYMWIRGR